VGLNFLTAREPVERRRALTRHVSHLSKGICALVGHVSLLFSCIKKDCPQEILHGAPPEVHVSHECLDMCNMEFDRGRV
jgi:hypothetical protein